MTVKVLRSPWRSGCLDRRGGQGCSDRRDAQGCSGRHDGQGAWADATSSRGWP